MHADQRLLVSKQPESLAKALLLLPKLKCRLLHRMSKRLAVIVVQEKAKQIETGFPRGVYVLREAAKAERILGKMDQGEALALAASSHESKPQLSVRPWEEEGFGGCDVD